MEDGFVPDARLRAMELEANKIFDIYRKQYFDGGYSSVYFFDTEAKDDKSFGACFLIHKGHTTTHTKSSCACNPSRMLPAVVVRSMLGLQSDALSLLSR